MTDLGTTLFSPIARQLAIDYQVETRYELEVKDALTGRRRGRHEVHDLHLVGLLAQLRNATATISAPAPDGDEGSRGKPESRAPSGLNPWHVYCEIRDAIRAWRRELCGHIEESPELDLVWLGRNVGEHSTHLADLTSDARRWVTVAELALGHRLPPTAYPQVRCEKRVITGGGYRTVGCKQTSLVGNLETDRAIWCNNGGPEGCHDDVNHPDCRQSDGSLSCRTSAFSLRHKIVWSSGELLGLVSQLAKAKPTEETAA